MKLTDSLFHLPDPAGSRAARAIPKSSQGHFVGEFVFGAEHPRRVRFESLLEFKVALCTVYRPRFVDLEEQIAPISFRRPDGDIGYHYLDYRVTFEGGIRLGMVVKPSYRAEQPAFIANVRAIAAAAVPDVVDRLTVVTERHIHPVEFWNAQLFHAARRPVQEEDRIIDRLASRLRAPVVIEDLMTQGRHDGVILFGIARTIQRGGLKLLRKERIELHALVAANDPRAAA
ncbi:hypothetical protein [Paracoccus sp. PARArs4]|uniref:hypothetical protein n=1 Tax=Paracoccus sp. PARArs4 TaxID=2853442 RepID=UPI0024A79839|nr:hypothetical protein [Paracoccus sp. PARArs4]